MEPNVREVEQARISESRVVLYHNPYCGFSRRALHLLDTKGVVPEVVVAAGNESLRSWLRDITGRFTLPQVFIGGRPVGGYSDLAELDARGELQSMLQASSRVAHG